MVIKALLRKIISLSLRLVNSPAPLKPQIILFLNITVLISQLCDPGELAITRQTPPWHSDTFQRAREQRGHSWGTPAESGASTPQSVMETDPLISVIWLLVVHTKTLVSINTVTWRTHVLLYKRTLTRWQSYIPDLVSAAQTFPATHYTREQTGPHMRRTHTQAGRGSQ